MRHLDYLMFDNLERMRKHSTKLNNDPQDFAHGFMGDDPNIRLPGCHYSDDRFRHAQTIWGRRRKRTIYDYSDRFSQWDYKLWHEAHDIAGTESQKKGCEWETGSVRYFELVLSHFHSQVDTHHVNPTDLTTVIVNSVVTIDHVLMSFNVSNGYDYKVFGYWFPKGKPWDKKDEEKDNEC